AVRWSNIRLHGERQPVRAIDYDADRARDARVGAHRVVPVAVDISVVADRPRDAVRPRLDVRASVAANAGTRGERELHTAIWCRVDAASEPLSARGRSRRRDERGGDDEMLHGGMHHGFRISLRSCRVRSSFRRISAWKAWFFTCESVLFFAMSKSLSE